MNGGLLGDDHLESGFTLIEFMIVVVVLGILAGFVLLGVQSFQQGSIEAVCRAEVDSLTTANVAYRYRHGADAANEDVLVTDGYIDQAPSYATLTNGVTDPATMDGCGAPILALAPGTGVTAISGSAAPSGASGGWSTDLTVTIRDGAGDPVPDVEVVGEWTDGTNARRCTTGADGTCGFNTHHAAADTSATWNVLTISGEVGDDSDPSISCMAVPTFGCS